MRKKVCECFVNVKIWGDPCYTLCGALHKRTVPQQASKGTEQPPECRMEPMPCLWLTLCLLPCLARHALCAFVAQPFPHRKVQYPPCVLFVPRVCASCALHYHMPLCLPLRVSCLSSVFFCLAVFGLLLSGQHGSQGSFLDPSGTTCFVASTLQGLFQLGSFCSHVRSHVPCESVAYLLCPLHSIKVRIFVAGLSISLLDVVRPAWDAAFALDHDFALTSLRWQNDAAEFLNNVFVCGPSGPFNVL